MIYWYTGQPGHGKTLNALDYLMELRDQDMAKAIVLPSTFLGRIKRQLFKLMRRPYAEQYDPAYQARQFFVCNVRGFDYAGTGFSEMTPEQFCDWTNFLPDRAVALVDEAYEHGMLPKRPAGSKVPHHVEQLAKHRHRGLDFIFISQSPDTQCDSFVRDLIDRHIHVRRLHGTKFIQLRTFDRFEAHAEKATPLTIRTVPLPDKAKGTYESTVLDTTQTKIPWYYFALPVLAITAGLLMYYTFGSMGSRLGGETPSSVAAANTGAGAATLQHGASATGWSGADSGDVLTPAQYAAKFIPRVPSEPWSAPAYDDALQLPMEPPRLFCMSSRDGIDGQGDHVDFSCTCLTEQGTPYVLDDSTCRFIARRGQYEPYRNRRDDRLADGPTQIDRGMDTIRNRNATVGYAPGQRADVFPRSPGYEASSYTGPTSTL